VRVIFTDRKASHGQAGRKWGCSLLAVVRPERLL
jgi:hypothetical protein